MLFIKSISYFLIIGFFKYLIKFLKLLILEIFKFEIVKSIILLFNK